MNDDINYFLRRSMVSVSLLKATSYSVDVLEQQLRTLLAPLGGMEAYVNPGQRVLLKPNLLTGSRPTKECTTRPEVVYCVAKLVQEVGGKQTPPLSLLQEVPNVGPETSRNLSCLKTETRAAHHALHCVHRDKQSHHEARNTRPLRHE